MDSKTKPGFTYLIELFDPQGKLLDTEIVHNLVPIEGLNYFLGTGIAGVTQATAHYIGLFEGNYTPIPAITAATIIAAATECTTYTPSARPAFTHGAIANGRADNSASRAEFTATADKTIYGGFISSVAAKGATSGRLISAVRFASPKAFTTGSVLRVTAGLEFISE
ncbi:MAG: hypothetical protein AAB131_18090 [Actinomycetota bacterium]|mgnify:CR=1 FL=1